MLLLCIGMQYLKHYNKTVKAWNAVQKYDNLAQVTICVCFTPASYFFKAPRSHEYDEAPFSLEIGMHS